MVDVVSFIPERVFTLTGYPAPGAGYTATFYLSGTTTPVTVYSDEDATVPHPSPVRANSNGVFPAVYVASGAGAIKAVIATASGATFATVDPAFKSSLAVSSAADIDFAPTDDILATDVQAAIVEVRSKFDEDISFLDDQKAVFGTSGDLEVYHNGTDSFISDVGTGAIVVQTNGTEVVIRTSTPETMARFTKDGAAELYHNGSKKFETSATGATVTGALDITGGITGATVAVAAVATTSGTTFDTAIPSWVNRIDICLNGNSLSGSDNMLVQLGDSGGVETSGYVSGSGESGVTSTSGFIILVGAAGRDVTGVLRIVRCGATNQWFSDHNVFVNSLGCRGGGGSKTLSDQITTVRLTRTGTDTFDLGAVAVRYSA